MRSLRIFYNNLFLKRRLFFALGLCCALFIFSFLFERIAPLAYAYFWMLMGFLTLDLIILFRQDGFSAGRSLPERLSNGDDNEIDVKIRSVYPFRIAVTLLDELPVQLQRRDHQLICDLDPDEEKMLNYMIRPLKRGAYEFGRLHGFVSSPLGLVERRFSFGDPLSIPVYPSFIQMKRYQLMASSNKLIEQGIKRIRRIGQSLEFEHIKPYSIGDDQRAVNWKATARRTELMVNSFTEERSQNLYCVIDKSRLMKMPFGGLSLLDYAINASLAISNIALLKDDKAGLISISEKAGAIIPADRKPLQLRRIMEALYNEKSRYLEINLEILYGIIRTSVKQRSLLLFFTNYESITGLRRQLPYLRRIAKYHRLVVIFFENTELAEMSTKPAMKLEDIYIQTLAVRFVTEKRLIVKELNQHGIQTILTRPENLSIETINKYLELKSRGF